MIVKTIGLVDGLAYVDKIICNESTNKKKGYIVYNKHYGTLKQITNDYGTIKRVKWNILKEL